MAMATQSEAEAPSISLESIKKRREHKFNADDRRSTRLKSSFDNDIIQSSQQEMGGSENQMLEDVIPLEDDAPIDASANSEAVEERIQQIRQKIEQFTQQVSGLLEAGKGFFVEVANAFEEGIVQLHQKQVEKWEEDIQMLRTIDSLNEDMSCRLSNAQTLICSVQGNADD